MIPTVTIDKKSLKLLGFMELAISKLNSVAAKDRVITFIFLKYDIMLALFPHKVFSVNEVTLSFFEDTKNYLINGIPDSRPGTKPEDAKYDIYWNNYRDWMRKHV